MQSFYVRNGLGRSVASLLQQVDLDMTFFGHLRVPRNGFFWAPNMAISWEGTKSHLPSQRLAVFPFFRLAICCLKTEDFISGAFFEKGFGRMSSSNGV